MAWMWIIAGPNGAGKSTLQTLLAGALGPEPCLHLNADELTAAFLAGGGKDQLLVANLLAAQTIDAQVADCIARRQGFLVETVLSSGKYRDDLEAARCKFFERADLRLVVSR